MKRHFLFLLLACACSLTAPAQSYLRKSLESTVAIANSTVNYQGGTNAVIDTAHPYYAFAHYRLRIATKPNEQVQRWQKAYAKELAQKTQPQRMLLQTTNNRERFLVPYAPDAPAIVASQADFPHLLLVRGDHPTRKGYEEIAVVNWKITEKGILEGTVTLVERQRGVKALSQDAQLPSRIRFPKGELNGFSEDFLRKFRGKQNRSMTPEQWEELEKMLHEKLKNYGWDAEKGDFSGQDSLSPFQQEEWQQLIKKVQKAPIFQLSPEELRSLFPQTEGAEGEAREQLLSGSQHYLRDQVEGYGRVAIEDWLLRLSFYNRQFTPTSDRYTQSSIRARTAEGLSLLPLMNRDDMTRAYARIADLMQKDKADTLSRGSHPSFRYSLSEINRAANLREVSDYDQWKTPLNLETKVSGTLIFRDESGQKRTVDYDREVGSFEVDPDEDQTYDVSTKKHRTPQKADFQLEFRKYALANGIFVQHSGKAYSSHFIDGACDAVLPFLGVRYVSVGDMEAPSKELLILTFDEDCPLTHPYSGARSQQQFTLLKGSYLIFETDNIH